MKQVIRTILAVMVAGLVILGVALAQQGGTGSSSGGAAGGPGYGPGTVPAVPGTSVPMPGEGTPPGAPPPAQAGGTPPEGGGAVEGGGGGAGLVSGEGATYVEMRKDQTVFQTACLKCHPKEKILSRRRTEAEWKDIVLNKHMMTGRINVSDAAPVLRYLTSNYGPTPPKPAAPTTRPATPPTVIPAFPAPPGASTAPGSTAAPPPAQGASPANPLPAQPQPGPPTP